MKILVDINHPAHVHLFKNLIWNLKDDNHDITITSREKDVTLDLLDHYGFDHETLTKVGDSLFELASEFIHKELKLLKIAKDMKPDLYIGLNPSIANVSSIIGGDSIILHDSEPTWLREYLFVPFTDVILTPQKFSKDLGSQHFRYPSYHELAYLHPNQFRPDKDSLAEFGINTEETYFVIRFIGWGAHHDVNQMGFSRKMKLRLVSYLSKHGTVYITSEESLPDELEKYKVTIPSHLIHDLLYYANLYVGDSQTMATEASLLGTPAIRSNSFAGEEDMSNFKELENEYDLLYSFYDEEKAFKKIKELVNKQRLKKEWKNKREKVLRDKIDLTSFLGWFIKNYPKSVDLLKEDKNYYQNVVE